jgi:uncharacterized membrane protein YfcA
VPFGLELVLAGLLVGILIGATGMGAGSLMAPILIGVFNVPALSVVGTDLLYSGVSKAVGGWQHLRLHTVNTELAYWMASGSVPASLLGVFTLHRLAAQEGAEIQDYLKQAIGFALLLVAVSVVVRTFFTVKGLWDHTGLFHDGPLTPRHKTLAVSVGLVFGFIFGLTSVGAGAFFGITLILFFPLTAKRVVGTDLFHGALVTIPAAIASYFLLPHLPLDNVLYLMIGSTPGILIGARLAVRMPERALRGSLAGVLFASALKTLGAF